MTDAQALAVREKRELAAKQEKTVPGRFFMPYTDIYETDEALMLAMEMPGVERGNIDLTLENDVLRVEAKIDYAKYQGLDPVYTEYNVGHYARSFALSGKLDREKIKADYNAGVLTITLPKSAESRPRRINIG